MPTNFYFNPFPLNQITSEQLLVEDLVIEAMQIYGMDIFYMPRSSRDSVDLLYGDSTLARRELNWLPKTNFEGLVIKMVKNDLKQIGL